MEPTAQTDAFCDFTTNMPTALHTLLYKIISMPFSNVKIAHERSKG